LSGGIEIGFLGGIVSAVEIIFGFKFPV